MARTPNFNNLQCALIEVTRLQGRGEKFSITEVLRKNKCALSYAPFFIKAQKLVKKDEHFGSADSIKIFYKILLELKKEHTVCKREVKPKQSLPTWVSTYTWDY